MIKKIYYSLILLITVLAICGFRVGSESLEDIRAKKKASKQGLAPSEPVLEYTETVTPEKTPQELYKQYHLLAVSSLDEAVSSFDDNKQWAFRMVDNAYRYLGLIKGLAKDENKAVFSGLMQDLEPLIDKIKKRNMAKMQRLDTVRDIKQISDRLERDFAWDKVKQWIRQ